MKKAKAQKREKSRIQKTILQNICRNSLATRTPKYIINKSLQFTVHGSRLVKTGYQRKAEQQFLRFCLIVELL
jgi:S-adenosylmethionine synthetase